MDTFSLTTKGVDVMGKIKYILTVSSLFFITHGIALAGGPNYTPQPTTIHTPTPTHASTHTPSPTYTTHPTPTATITPTYTPYATLTPNPTGNE